MILQSTTDFVLEQLNTPYTDSEKIRVIGNYVRFIKQPLNLGMFVPCDLDNNVLEVPEKVDLYNHTIGDYEKQLIYQQAKERVLFEGFELCKDAAFYGKVIRNKDNSVRIYVQDKYDIESLIRRDFEITLTKSAQKQIGL